MSQSAKWPEKEKPNISLDSTNMINSFSFFYISIPLSVATLYLSCHLFMTHNAGHFISRATSTQGHSTVSTGLACKLASRGTCTKPLRNTAQRGKYFQIWRENWEKTSYCSYSMTAVLDWSAEPRCISLSLEPGLRYVCFIVILIQA